MSSLRVTNIFKFDEYNKKQLNRSIYHCTFSQTEHIHKFLFELLNISRIPFWGLTYAWFTSGDADEQYYSVYHKMEILSYGHCHIKCGLYTHCSKLNRGRFLIADENLTAISFKTWNSYKHNRKINMVLKLLIYQHT